MRGVGWAIVVIAAGCGGSTEPAGLPPLGRYAYEMAVPASVSGAMTRTFSGTLVVTYITRDSLAGRWDVPASTYTSGAAAPGYQARLSLGFWNGGGWYFNAYPADADGGTVQHRLYPGNPPRCDGAALYLSGGSIVRRDGLCMVQFVGP